MATNGRHPKTHRENDGDDEGLDPKKARETTLRDELRACIAELSDFVLARRCAPIMVRLAWHDAGTYDKEVEEWPKCGGANGSIRFAAELAHGANAGLGKAVEMLEPFAKKYPSISYADLYQMASVVGIEAAGGPKISLRYGRKDAGDESGCPPENNLPGAKAPFHDNAKNPAAHLRNIFHRMGLTDQDIVALSGAHTLGRAYKDRSGMGADSTEYTKDVAEGVTPGGSSWTKEWLKFDNSYFVDVKSKKDANLLVLETDACLFEDEEFRVFANKYAEDQDAFFANYEEAHMKLSELGVKWIDDEPIVLED
ncbi:unnamed protein product [Ostreobium quekettii]|uniref:L-ascorbate peroxidase n=1 Tax=Ostreobium quekettii TaxID=121088 RepID=A0A8S1J3P1_9CHLO|nr:unnamed protein product [Ostreobium quekettii]|eukprot:evm.model.scf_598EXC.7 EVM.evm.TU.scf_598EXC.7   scf_598EXC:70902-74164(-)